MGYGDDVQYVYDKARRICNSKEKGDYGYLIEELNTYTKAMIKFRNELVVLNEVDWYKVPVDTLLNVSNDGLTWYKRYYAGYDNCRPCVFADGATSKTTEGTLVPYKFMQKTNEK